MRLFPKLLATAALVGLGTPVLFFASDTPAPAADHLDPPSRTDPDVDTRPDMPADIADVYAFHSSTRVVAALTFAGPQAGMAASYDRDVIYTINISNAGARTDPEFQIKVKFGQNGPVNGVQFVGVPGTTATVVGPVETNLANNGVLMRAGLVADPFFFDLLGFRATRSSGTLSIRSDRDFFAGKNDTAIVIDMPRAALENNGHVIDIWATTSRFGGNI